MLCEQAMTLNFHSLDFGSYRRKKTALKLSFEAKIRNGKRMHFATVHKTHPELDLDKRKKIAKLSAIKETTNIFL